MVSVKKVTGASPLSEFQLHIGVMVSTILNTKFFISGTLYLDTGIAVSLIIKKWCNLHGLTIKLKSGVTIMSALGKELNIVGTTCMMVMLAVTLKIDLREVAVSSEDFY